MFLQELWVPYTEERNMNNQFLEYSVQISTPDQFIPAEDRLSSGDHTWHGAALFWHSSLDYLVTTIANTNDRFTGLKLNSSPQPILAISLYLPTSGKDDEFLGCLAELSLFIVENCVETGTVVLIGTDANCSDRSSSRRSQGFQEFCTQHNLLKIQQSEPTYHHFNGVSSSNIDFFLISCAHSNKLGNIVSQCTQDNPGNFSCHDPIVASLQTSFPAQEKKTALFSHTYSNFEQPRVIWNKERLCDYQNIAAKALSYFEAFFPTKEFIPLKCELYSSLLVRSAEICLDRKPVPTKRQQRNSPRVHQAWQHLQKMFKIWKNNGKVKDSSCIAFTMYLSARSKFQHVRRYQHNLKMIKLNNELMNSNFRDRNKHFKLVNRARGKGINPNKYLTSLSTPVGDYFGSDTLEGFASDVEHLGKDVGESPEYDNQFYRLCIQDNKYIFDIKTENDKKLPKMKKEDLDNIIDKEMKMGKACDIYKCTPEHLKYAGTGARMAILNLVNEIIENMSYLACPQIKAGLGTAIHKGKKKPVSLASSYRRITVTPQLGSIIDRFVDPEAERIFLQVQSSDQYGFTKNISYLMGAVLRGECQRWALDTKQTCFGISFDGQAAFPSVDRNIQIRELYSCGESGDLLLYSSNTYKNTVCKMKQGNKLSREIAEHKGNRQGHKRAAGNFKAYINPCLIAANKPKLGFFIGPICVSVVSIADDTYVLSNNPRNLQSLINIIGHYGRRYRLIFGANKTKITVTGSRQDMEYYKDIQLWTLYGEKLNVTDDNDHLGLVVSGSNEEIKNIDRNIAAARASLFSFLGNIFAYKCKLSQAVQFHTWVTFIKPVLRSGLAALPIRPTTVKSLEIFHHKILRAILKLSKYSPVVPLYFLLGEPPISATLHLDVLSLFWNIWSNPQTKANEAVKYLLQMCDEKSLTWSAHVRILFALYSLPDPLALLGTPAWPKEKWKEYTKAAVVSYHEHTLRQKAGTNRKLKYLNVQTLSLLGKPHPILSWVSTTRDTVVIRPHLKMLSGDYLCYENLSHDRGFKANCPMCQAMAPDHPAPDETLQHLLTRCRATAETRNRLIPDLLNVIASYFPYNDLLSYPKHNHLAQFILDCSSLNLPTNVRIDASMPGYKSIAKQCSHTVHAIHKDRIRQMKALGIL